MAHQVCAGHFFALNVTAMEQLSLREHRALIAQQNAQQNGQEKAKSPFPASMREPSKTQLEGLQCSWEKFKEENGGKDECPDLAVLEEFFWWFAQNSKGRLGEKSTIHTLVYQVGRVASMLKFYYGYVISEELKESIRIFLRTEAAEGLELSFAQYEKLIADWKDVDEMTIFMLKYDSHRYKPRIFAQIIWSLLLIADTGERGGGFTLSECYRKSKDPNDTLCFKDASLYYRPRQKPGDSPGLRLELIFRNRKGARGKPANHHKKLKQSYYSRKNCYSCVVFWFLVIAFDDDAFSSSPAELYAQTNTSESEIQIPLKPEILNKPILRRWIRSENALSPTDAWGYGSLLAQGKRVVKDALFPGRFTFYNIRRGVANKLNNCPLTTPEVRKQVMGQQCPSDSIFQRFYQSQQIIVDSGNIFRGEETLIDRAEVLSMHLHRDKSSLQVPEYSRTRANLVAALFPENQEPNALDCVRKGLDLLNDSTAFVTPKSRPPVTTSSNLSFVSPSGPQIISIPNGNPLKWTEEENELLLSLKQTTNLDWKQIATRFQSRTLNAVKMQYRMIGKASSFTSPWTEAENLELLRLKQTANLGWKGIAEQLPGRTAGAVKQRYVTLQAPQIKKKPQWAEEEDGKLLSLKDTTNLSWGDISAELEGRTVGAVRKRYLVLCGSGDAECTKTKLRRVAWTWKENETLMNLRFANRDWPELAIAFPDRTISAIKSQAYLLERAWTGSFTEAEQRELKDLLEEHADDYRKAYYAIRVRFSSRQASSIQAGIQDLKAQRKRKRQNDTVETANTKRLKLHPLPED